MTLILFIVILGLIIFIHEFGHFIFAKKAGIHVYEFSLGFGPKLFSFRRKNDETEYMVKLIPLGGYVALAGETADDDQNNEVDSSKKLYNKSFLRQFSFILWLYRVAPFDRNEWHNETEIGGTKRTVISNIVVVCVVV